MDRHYSTLPANISKHLSSENLPPGRDFLKRYLETSGYLPSATDKPTNDKPNGSNLKPVAANILGRRPSGAAPSKEDDAKAKAAASAGGGAGGVAKPQQSTNLSSPTKTTGAGAPPGGSPLPAAAAPTPAADKKAVAPVTVVPGSGGKDAKSGAPSVAIDGSKGVLAAVSELATKFADQKNATQWKQPLYV